MHPVCDPLPEITGGDRTSRLASRDMSGDNPLGTILGIWAHPDDETWLCAGLMARAARAGDRVVCVTATRGELGSPDEERWPSGAPLAAVRTAEMERRARRPRRHRAPLARLPRRRVRGRRPGRGRTPGHRPDGGGAARHGADLRPGRDDRARRPQGRLPLGDRGVRGRGPSRARCWATRPTRRSGWRSSASRWTGSTCSWAPSRRARRGTSSCSACSWRASCSRPSWPRSRR